MTKKQAGQARLFGTRGPLDKRDTVRNWLPSIKKNKLKSHSEKLAYYSGVHEVLSFLSVASDNYPWGQMSKMLDGLAEDCVGVLYIASAPRTEPLNYKAKDSAETASRGARKRPVSGKRNSKR